MSAVASALDLLVPPVRLGIGIRHVIRDDDDAALPQTPGLRADECDGVWRVMHDESRHRRVERRIRSHVEHGSLLERGPVRECGTSRPGATEHLTREIDSVNAVPGAQECLGDDSGTTAGVEHPRFGLQRGKRHQPRKRRRIGLDGCALEAGSLAVERVRKRPFMRVHGSLEYTRPSIVAI